MKDNKDLFDLFKENEHKIQPTPSRHAWDKLERKLDARKGINQTSKYRSIAQIAAVVAVVSIAAVIALLNTGSGDSKKNIAASTPAKERVSTWQEIAREKASKDGNSVVAADKKVDAKQVLMNEGAKDQKSTPKVNRPKTASNKIQNYNDKELAGDIDIASNTYEMHEAPLEREMVLGEVTINDKTTIEEIERKVFGNQANGNNIAAAANKEPAKAKDAMIAVDRFDGAAMEVEEETMIAVSTTSTPALSNNNSTETITTTGSPKYVITEVNAPDTDTDISVGERNNEFFDKKMEQTSPADRRLEESLAEAATKVTKKRKARDIFSRNKAKVRKSESLVPTIGIAADASAEKESYSPLSWLKGKWISENGVKREWVKESGNKVSFKDPATGTIEYELTQNNSVLFNANTNLSYTYSFVDDVEHSFFTTQKEEREYVVEIIKESDVQFRIISYHTLRKEIAFMRDEKLVREDLVERVFERE